MLRSDARVGDEKAASELFHFPMRRNLSQPLDAGVLQGHIGVEALGDGVADEGSALFLEQFDQPLLLGDEGVDFGCFTVEEGGDGALFGKRDGVGILNTISDLFLANAFGMTWSPYPSEINPAGRLNCSARNRTR